jgi:hypothetical protein
MDDDPNRDETTTTGKGITKDTESRPVRVAMDVLESGFVYPIKCKRLYVKLDII